MAVPGWMNVASQGLSLFSGLSGLFGKRKKTPAERAAEKGYGYTEDMIEKYLLPAAEQEVSPELETAHNLNMQDIDRTGRAAVDQTNKYWSRRGDVARAGGSATRAKLETMRARMRETSDAALKQLDVKNANRQLLLQASSSLTGSGISGIGPMIGAQSIDGANRDMVSEDLGDIISSYEAQDQMDRMWEILEGRGYSQQDYGHLFGEAPRVPAGVSVTDGQQTQIPGHARSLGIRDEVPTVRGGPLNIKPPLVFRRPGIGGSY